MMEDLDIVYISYDEPKANEFFADLKKKSPREPLRVHGVKGFDAAHKAAANLAKTKRFITVDGDCLVRPSFFKVDIKLESDYVYSFSALNTANGLSYGNGGVKIWPKKLVLTVDTHEKGKGNDFCWTYRYWQVNNIASDVYYHSAYHAFRAGFREAVKLSLVQDKKLSTWKETREKMYQPNLSRLIVWATVGTDTEFGQWAIYGARSGLAHIWLDNSNIDLIHNYDWFNEKWKQVQGTSPTVANERSADWLSRLLYMKFPNLTPEISKWVKTIYINPERHGPMLPNLKPLI